MTRMALRLSVSNRARNRFRSSSDRFHSSAGRARSTNDRVRSGFPDGKSSVNETFGLRKRGRTVFERHDRDCDKGRVLVNREALNRCNLIDKTSY